MSERRQIPEADYEELRIALVMNGGVSLAVWIGGVTHEINRVMRREGLYGELLDLTATAVRVDVISGTSAGGINGALLALARAYDVDLSPLRDVWLQSGSLERLLHSPYDRDASSLLKGNARFFDDLRQAFRDIRGSGDITNPAEVPLDLTLSTTMLHGVANRSTDDFGVPLGDVNHRGRFHFRRGEELETDAFADEIIAERLALASRATASFPVAFEPIYCPVKPKDPLTDARLVDMAGAASFETSRFLLDGGILDNRPLEAAIEAVLRQRTSREVRRVLAYVVPSPGQTSLENGDAIGASPTLGEVALASLTELPRVESISAQLKAVIEHNRLAHRKRETRMALIRELGPQGMQDLATKLFDVYRRRRLEGAVEYICEELAASMAGRLPAVTIGRRRREWIGRQFLSLPDLPWVPSSLHVPTNLGDEAALQRWGWGAYAVEHIVEMLFDVFRRALIVAPLGASEAVDLRARLKEGYAIAYELARAIPEQRRLDRAFWVRYAGPLVSVMGVEPDQLATKARAWAEQAVDDWSARTTVLTLGEKSGAYLRGAVSPGGYMPVAEALGRLASAMAAVLADALDDIETAGTLGLVNGRTEQDHEAARDVLAYVHYLKTEGTRDAEGLLARLLTLEVVQYSTGAHRDVPEQFLELVQISANVPNAFGGPATAAEKLAGAQLANFGGFYKKAWRANDWMFGRLDGAERLAHILLNPARLARLHAGRLENLVTALHKVAVPAGIDPDARSLLEEHWQKRERLVRAELAFLERPDIPVPEQLPHSVRAILAKLHLAIIRDELRVLVGAAQDDRRSGAGATGPSANLIAAAERLIDGTGPTTWDNLPSSSLIALFKGNQIGQERFAGEVGTELFTSHLTRSLAVATSMVASPRAGLGSLGRVLTLVRIPMLIIDGLAQNAVAASKTSAFISGFVLALSGAIVVLLLFPSLSIPSPVGWVGSLAFVASVAVALRRRGRFVVWWLLVSAAIWAWIKLEPTVATYIRRWLAP